MSNQYLPLNEAAQLANKSSQTIRRLIKLNKIRYRRKKTPQGFNYYIDQISLMNYYNLPVSTNQYEPNVNTHVNSSELKTEINNDLSTSQKPVRLGNNMTTQERGDTSTFFDLKKDPILSSQDNLTSQHNTIVQEVDYSQANEVASDRLHDVEVGDFETDEDEITDKQKDAIIQELDSQKKLSQEFQQTMQKLIDQHQFDKKKLYDLVSNFQQRIFILEDHIKKLEAPKKKWYQVWK